MSLIPLVTSDSSGEAAEALREVTRERGVEANFYRLFANSPGVLRTICPLVWELWSSPHLSRRLLELTILRVAQVTNAPYEWVHHVPMALDARLQRHQIAELLTWQVSDEFDDIERLVLTATDALLAHRAIPEGVLRELQQKTSHAAVTEIITAVGLYSLIAGMLRSAQAPVEDWAPLNDDMPFVGMDPAYR